MLDRSCGIASPEEDFSTETESTPEPRLFTKLLEDLGRSLELTQDILSPDAGMRRPVEPEVGERHRRVGDDPPRADRASTLNGLRQHAVGALHLARLPERATKGRQKAQTAWVVCRKQGRGSLEQIGRSECVSAGIRAQS